MFQSISSFFPFPFLQKELEFKEGVAIYIRSAAYFDFVVNLQTEADRVAKLARDLEGRITRLGPGIDNAAVAAAEKASNGKNKKGKGSAAGKKAKGKLKGREEEVDFDDDGELERVAAMLKKLKKQKVRLSR